jgi:uncharacterized damage-inducible protein DinB
MPNPCLRPSSWPVPTDRLSQLDRKRRPRVFRVWPVGTLAPMVDLAPVGPDDDVTGGPEPTPAAKLLLDAFDRIAGSVEQVLDGLDADQLTARPAPSANSIAWLVWHLTRIQDDHLAGAFGHEQVWTAQGWEARFGLPFDTAATGYSHSSDEVGAVRADGSLLGEYHRAVHDRTQRVLRGLQDRNLDRVVDESWDPPVTLGVRLVSVVTDDLQHVGQAAYIKGLLEEDGAG